MIKKHNEINEFVDKIEQDLIQFFHVYGITSFEKKKGIFLNSLCYQTTETRPETKLVNEILYNLNYIKFDEEARQDKEWHIEQLGETLGLFRAFLHTFVYSTPKENVYDFRIFDRTNPRSNISKLRKRLYNL